MGSSQYLYCKDKNVAIYVGKGIYTVEKDNTDMYDFIHYMSEEDKRKKDVMEYLWDRMLIEGPFDMLIKLMVSYNPEYEWDIIYDYDLSELKDVTVIG